MLRKLKTGSFRFDFCLEMDFESAMQTFAEAWMAANRGGRILIPTENQPKIQDSNGSGSGGKTEEEENSKNGDDERVSLNFS